MAISTEPTIMPIPCQSSINTRYMNEGTEHKVLPHKLLLWQWTQRERPSSPSPSTLPSPLPPAHHLHLLGEQRPMAHSFRQAHRGPNACLCVSRSSVPPKGWKGPASQGPWLFNVLPPTFPHPPNLKTKWNNCWFRSRPRRRCHHISNLEYTWRELAE